MNINDFLLSFSNSLIEIAFYYIIIISLLQKRLMPNLYKTAFCILLILSNILVNMFIEDEIVYTAVSIFFIFLITIVISGENIIHILYIFMISYSISLIIQLLLIIPFTFLLTDSSNPANMLTGNILTLIIAFIVYRLVPIHYIYNFIITKDFYFRLILANILISTILIICIYRTKLSNAIILLPIIAIYLTLVIIFNIIFINSKIKLENQQNIINSYNEYLPVVEELIKQVRERQHQYKNDLASLNALPLTYKDYDTLCLELSKNIDALSTDSTPSFLLSFNLKLMSGFLYREYIKASKMRIHMSFNIRNYNIQTTFPEYKLTQAIGILIDNAIEASIEDDTIFIDIDCISNQFIFSISNPGPIITPDLLSNFFKGGYSTKNKNSLNRGIGLCILKNMLNGHNGSIHVLNEFIEGRTYIKFIIKI